MIDPADQGPISARLNGLWDAAAVGLFVLAVIVYLALPIWLATRLAEATGKGWLIFSVWPLWGAPLLCRPVRRWWFDA